MRILARNIVIDPKVRFGKPIIRGTRITVEEALGFLGSGMEYTDIEQEYGLTHADLQAAVQYANAFLHGEETAPATLLRA